MGRQAVFKNKVWICVEQTDAQATKKKKMGEYSSSTICKDGHMLSKT